MTGDPTWAVIGPILVVVGSARGLGAAPRAHGTR